MPNKTMSATLAASDKALEKIYRPDNIVIKDNGRDYTEVPLNSKTILRVDPNRTGDAATKYNRALKQSQEQSNTKQRAGNIRPAAKVKQSKNDIIYAY